VWRLGLFDCAGVSREKGMVGHVTEAFVSHLEEVGVLDLKEGVIVIVEEEEEEEMVCPLC
jgi:hypothetical protein